jgi:hypothetical protein
MHPQDAISLFGALWGVAAENARLIALFATARHFELWRIVVISRRIIEILPIHDRTVQKAHSKELSTHE